MSITHSDVKATARMSMITKIWKALPLESKQVFKSGARQDLTRFNKME